MTLGYESTIYCDRPEATLGKIMREAVNEYLSLNLKVLVIENSDRSILLKKPGFLKIGGAKLTISIKEKSFLILSESIISDGYDYGTNHDNVRAIYTCFENAIQELS